MTPERWEKIKRLFSSAQDCAEGERSDFLLRECGGDADLKLEVERLLESSKEDAFLEDSAVAEVASAVDRGVEAGRDEKPPRFEAGDILNNRYGIIRLLGRGGMGEVYLATDSRINRSVALKVLHSDLVSSEESLRRFALEAQAVSALNHPHIMTIYEFDNTNDGSLFIVAEYIDGQNLNRFIRSGNGIDKALDIAIQVSSALSAAHEAGITHRDIKPENLIVRGDGYVKVLDFGLAKLTQPQQTPARVSTSGPEDDTKALQKTRPGAVMGTAAYMSPEQARGLHVDERTDIWSLGVVLYEMLCGKRPFTGDTSADIMVAVLLREPQPLSSFIPDLPPELDWIVSKSLSKNVEGRYQTAKELRADLDKIRKRIEFDESASHGGSRSFADIGEMEGVETDGGEVRATGRSSDERERYFWPLHSFHQIVAEAGSHRLRSSLVAVFMVALISSLAYLGVTRLTRTSAIDSIAVLPFVNSTGDAELAYLSDGLSETLIDRFAQLPQLRVIARNSSFKFRGADVDPQQAASQLGVRAVVTGTVTKIGEEILIRVDVVDAAENRHLTGAQYRRKLTDLTSLQGEIARLTAEQFSGKLSETESRRLTASETENSEAFRYYLNGLVARDGTKAGREKALRFYEKAIELDPGFAIAYAEIGWIHWANANADEDPGKAMPKAREAVEKALSLDPDLAKAHVVMATIREYEFDWAGAERAYQRAIELSPNLDFARNNYAFFLSLLDRQTEALAQLEEQRVRDPLNQRMWLLQKGIVLVQARKFDAALEAYSQAQAVEPTKSIPDFALGYAYAGKGLHGEAIGYYDREIEDMGMQDEFSQPLLYKAIGCAQLPERRAEGRAILSRIEAMNVYLSPALLAALYTALGDNDKAMELLERAYIKRDLLLRYVGVAYEYDGLRNDPRFADLMMRSGLKTVN